MIKAIFLSRFHSEKGPVVAHQIPEGSIITSSYATISRPLFDFSSISSYLIPSQEFCNRLVTICANRCRIIGYPVCINDPGKYNRNEYIFNVSIVLDENEDFTSFEGVVRKLAKLFQELEVGRSLLSKEEKELEEKNGVGVGEREVVKKDMGGFGKLVHTAAPHIGGRVYAICEMILEDLNNYCECMTPIDSANTLNMKLFPSHPPPARVKPYHVPLATTRLTNLASAQTWDLTTSRILPYINGVNSVADISRLADADIRLVRRSILHLLYYGFLLLLDIFTANAVYAPTPDIGVIFTDEEMQEECARYTATSELHVMSKNAVMQLYASIRHGLTVKAWCLENEEVLQGVDVRRFITFGVIKGFLYRVHKYALSVAPDAVDSNGFLWPGFAHDGSKQAVRVADEEDARGLRSGEESVQSLTPTGIERQDLPMTKYLDGMHPFDEICTALGLSEKVVLAKMKDYGEMQLIYR